MSFGKSSSNFIWLSCVRADLKGLLIKQSIITAKEFEVVAILKSR